MTEDAAELQRRLDTVDYLVDTVLNYPTMSEAYKVAALDATNKIRAVNMFVNGSQDAPPVPDEAVPAWLADPARLDTASARSAWLARSRQGRWRSCRLSCSKDSTSA